MRKPEENSRWVGCKGKFVTEDTFVVTMRARKARLENLRMEERRSR